MKLSAPLIRRLTEKGRYLDGDGLYLDVSKSGTKSWIYRYQVNRHRRDMGLGSYPSLSLKEARYKRDCLKIKVKDGHDPLTERDLEREKARKLSEMTFALLSRLCFEENHKAWKNQKHRQQWINTLKTYAYPVIGDLPMNKILSRHIKDILSPIWLEKPETARRVRQRIEKVWYWGKVLEYCSGDNPAIFKGNLEYVLPKQPPLHQSHHKALPHAEIPSFWAKLLKIQNLSSLALQLLILTAARTSEVLEAKWREFDFEKEIWIIPRERMKTGKEHRIPLSSHTINLLHHIQTVFPSEEFVFSKGRGVPLSNMAMLSLIKREFPKLAITVHGFRSSFRDWGETSNAYSHRSLEYSLGHSVQNKVESAYQRDDLLLLRRKIMMNWAVYLYQENEVLAFPSDFMKKRC